MFTLNEIKTAHAKVKSGADYPAYVQEIIKMGVTGYETYVDNGNTIYFGNNNYRIESGPKYDLLLVNEKSDPDTFKTELKAHQNGKTDFPTFCNIAAHAGVQKWVVNTDAMTCTYFDKNGVALLVESIPDASNISIPATTA